MLKADAVPTIIKDNWQVCGASCSFNLNRPYRVLKMLRNILFVHAIFMHNNDYMHKCNYQS